MNPRKYLAFAVVAAVLSLASCSGVNNVCTSNCTGGGGTASLNLTLAATPFVPPPGTSLLSFAVTINSVSLTPASGGSVVTIPLNAGTFTIDLTKLQSDSTFVGQVISNMPQAHTTRSPSESPVPWSRIARQAAAPLAAIRGALHRSVPAPLCQRRPLFR